MTHRIAERRKFRLVATLSAVAVVGAGTATVALAARDGEPAPVTAFVRIEEVKPNVVAPKVRQGGAGGVFTVDCGANENGKFSADNPVAQPGLPHGAQHVHDFVGNLSISAESTDDSLADSETTCKNGDKSSYFWPVVRINPKANQNSSGSNPDKVKEAGAPHIACPSVSDRLPAVPQQARGEIDRNLQLLDQQLKEANDRVARNENPADPNFVNNAILGPLRSKRVAALDRMAIAIGRSAPKPNLTSLAECELFFGAGHGGNGQAPRKFSGQLGGSEGHGDHGQAPRKFAGQPGESATPTVKCPSVRGALGAVPDQAIAEVDRNLALLDKQIAEANQRIVTTKGQGGPNFINNAILGPLKDKRVATIDRMAIAIGRNAQKPQGLERLAPCKLSNDNGGGNNNGGNNDGNSNGGGNAPLAVPSGPNLELVGNNGKIQRPAQVKIEYRGNATSKVTAMPKFLKMIVGD
ncbi:DUF1996 domain-containing protein, partial [Lentzea terrae]|uniref:DUF1996 domain-containing protein n=1 Tax=Lentzea terrae TaxID=2200761 RepID=UPI0018E59766